MIATWEVTYRTTEGEIAVVHYAGGSAQQARDSLRLDFSDVYQGLRVRSVA